jgi:hypothetical protein
METPLVPETLPQTLATCLQIVLESHSEPNLSPEPAKTSLVLPFSSLIKILVNSLSLTPQPQLSYL